MPEDITPIVSVDADVKPVTEAGVTVSIVTAVAEETLLINCPVVQIAVAEDAVNVNSSCQLVVCETEAKTALEVSDVNDTAPHIGVN